MKILKKILLVVAILVAIPLLAALFISNDYQVSRSVSINRANDEVFDYIKLQRNQEQYSKWVMEDPKMKKDFRGTDGMVGFIYAWDSKEMGAGEQEIKHIEAGREVQTELRFKRPMESVAVATMTTKPETPNQTLVQWNMKGRSPYPFNFMNLFMDNMLGGDMQSSLNRLKSNLEQK